MRSPADDRNLLFAVLALQADVLTPDRFVEGCTAWAGQKDTPLADLLVRKGWVTADERADVDRLLERKLSKHAGRVEAALAEATTDRVRQSLAGSPDPVLATIAGTPTPPDPNTVFISTVQFPPDDHDRYTVTRLHATGGIGRVWLARDEPLGREVALKELLPDRSASGPVLSRFLKEARITGQLEHPGIVPVYDLGKRATDDRPFYTMRFVRGRTFREAIQAYHRKRAQGTLTPLDRPELLTAFVGVCNAVAFAHSKGVIHRDLKPANVVLGDYGEVVVLDWGLAKVVGEPDDPAATVPLDPPPQLTADADQKTEFGQVLGTPAYMAPEQAAGQLDRIDARTDVYGLGAILFELLTNSLPFGGGSTLEVLDRVRHTPPSRPSAVVPGTPRPLEAVCLKCLQKEPADRYPSAKAVAEDVLHFLADEPVSAYPEPWAVRARRWAKRNRLIVTSAVAALALAVPILVVGLILLDGSARRERDAKERAEENRAKAEANYDRARRSAELMAGELARGIRPIAGTQRGTVIDILDRARAVYDDLLTDPDAPPDVLRGQARTWLLFAELYRETNRTGLGLEAADKCLALTDRLIASPHAAAEDHVFRGKALHRRAWIRYDQGYKAESEAGLEECLKELEHAGEDPAVAAGYVGSAHTMIGNIHTDRGDIPLAKKRYQLGLDVREKALKLAPTDPEVRTGMALSLEKFGLCKASTGERKAGLDMLRRAWAVYEDLAKEKPNDSEVHLHLVRAVTSLVQVSQDDDEKAACSRRTAAVTERFAARDPDHMEWERQAIRQRFYQEQAAAKPDVMTPEIRVRVAKRQLQFLTEMAALMRKRNDQDPENYLWKADTANLAQRVGKAHYDLAKLGVDADANLKAAASLAEQSAAEYEVVMKRTLASHATLQGWAYAHWLYAEVAVAQGRPADAFRRMFDYPQREIPYFRDLYRKDTTNGFALREFQRVTALNNRLPLPETLKLFEPVKDDPEVVRGFVALLRILTDVPPDANDSVKAAYSKGQRAIAPYGRMLLPSAVLTADDKRRIEGLPAE